MKNLIIKNLSNPRKPLAMPSAISVLPLRSAAKFIGELTACLMKGTPGDKVETTRSEEAFAPQHERGHEKANDTDSKSPSYRESMTWDIPAAGLATPQYTPLTERTISIPLERKQTKSKREEATDLVSKLNLARPTMPRDIEAGELGITELASSEKEARLAVPDMKQPEPKHEKATGSEANLHSIRSSMPHESAVSGSGLTKSALQQSETARVLSEMKQPPETPKRPVGVSAASHKQIGNTSQSGGAVASPTASPLKTVSMQDAPKNTREAPLPPRNVTIKEIQQTDTSNTRTRLRSENRRPENETKISPNTAEVKREEARAKIQIPAKSGQIPLGNLRIQRFDDLVPKGRTIPIQTPVVRAEKLERQGDAIRAQSEPPQRFAQDSSNANRKTEQPTLGKTTVSPKLQQHQTSSTLVSPPREETTSRLPTQNNSVRTLSYAESTGNANTTPRTGIQSGGTRHQSPVEMTRVSTTSHEIPVSKSKSESKEALIQTYAPTRVVRKTDVSDSAERKLPLPATAKTSSDATSSLAMRTLTADRPTTFEPPKDHGVEIRSTESGKRQSEPTLRQVRPNSEFPGKYAEEVLKDIVPGGSETKLQETPSKHGRVEVLQNVPRSSQRRQEVNRPDSARKAESLKNTASREMGAAATTGMAKRTQGTLAKPSQAASPGREIRESGPVQKSIHQAAEPVSDLLRNGSLLNEKASVIRAATREKPNVLRERPRVENASRGNDGIREEAILKSDVKSQRPSKELVSSAIDDKLLDSRPPKARIATQASKLGNDNGLPAKQSEELRDQAPQEIGDKSPARSQEPKRWQASFENGNRLKEAHVTRILGEASELRLSKSASPNQQLPLGVPSASQTPNKSVYPTVSLASSAEEHKVPVTRIFEPLKETRQQSRTEFLASGGIQEQKAAQISQFAENHRTERAVELLRFANLKNPNGDGPQKRSGSTEPETSGSIGSAKERLGFAQETPVMPEQTRILAMPVREIPNKNRGRILDSPTVHSTHPLRDAARKEAAMESFANRKPLPLTRNLSKAVMPEMPKTETFASSERRTEPAAAPALPMKTVEKTAKAEGTAMHSQQLSQQDAHAEISNHPLTTMKSQNGESLDVDSPILRQSPLLAKVEQLRELRSLLQQVLRTSQPLRLDKGSGLRFLWASQEWGPVQFVIGQHEREVVAKVQVQDPKVKVLLETHREGLQQIFAEQGLRLDRFEIDATHEAKLPSIPEVQWDEPRRRQTRPQEPFVTTLWNSDEERLTEPLLLEKRPTARRLWIA